MIPFQEYFWTLKYRFPGSAEFDIANFWDLPFEYVINAAHASEELHRRQLHDYEMPIALMMLQTAEMNRDRKKNKKPFKLENFCFYQDPAEINSPAAKYGAAANALISNNQMPPWALFVYSELKKNSDKANPPEPVALLSEYAIVLAPSCEDGECSGMLIADKVASGSIVEFTSTCGQTLKLMLPSFQASAYAQEDVVLRVIA